MPIVKDSLGLTKEDIYYSNFASGKFRGRRVSVSACLVVLVYLVLSFSLPFYIFSPPVPISP